MHAIVLFIKIKDVGATNGWRMDDEVTAREVLDVINREYPVQSIDPGYRGEAAQRRPLPTAAARSA